MENEKVCFNLPPAELGKIDVLVAQGLYASRTDLIRAGIRQVLEQNQAPVRALETAARAKTAYSFFVGISVLDRAALERFRRDGKRYSALVIGTLSIAKDVDPDLAEAAIGEIRVFGTVRAPKAVLARLGPRIKHGLMS